MPHRLNDDATFEPVELPTDRQVLPPWVRGASVFWWQGYSNEPDLMVTVPTPRYLQDRFPEGTPLHQCRWDKLWPDPTVYREERPGFYVARHEDGRVLHLSHEEFSRLRPETVDVQPATHWEAEGLSGKFSSFDEALEALRLLRPGSDCYNKVKAQFTRQDMLVSRQSEGFGGRAFDVTVERPDGQRFPVRLRGPWHGCPPAGTVECAGSDSVVLTITEDLFLRVVATHLPHLVVYRTRRHERSVEYRLEVAHADWGCPKGWLPADHPVNQYGVRNEWSYRAARR